MANWTFLTHHGHVMVALAADPTLTIDQIAAQVGITSRSTAGILNDLVQAGYVVKGKSGRKNTYEVHGEIPMRHPLNEMAKVSDLLEIFKK